VLVILSGIALPRSEGVWRASGSDGSARASENKADGVEAIGSTAGDEAAEAGGSMKRDVLARCRRKKGHALDAASWAGGALEDPLMAGSSLALQQTFPAPKAILNSPPRWWRVRTSPSR
jgi:hypothetical protein